MTEEEY